MKGIAICTPLCEMTQAHATTDEQIDVARVTVDEVKARIDRGEPIAFIDARSVSSWGESDEQIRGSIRVPPDDVNAHLAEIPKDRSIVTYCTCTRCMAASKRGRPRMERWNRKTGVRG